MPKSQRTYNNNRVYPMGSVAPDDSGGMKRYDGIRPAMKKGPQPVDMGTTSGRGQAKRFFKGAESEGH